MHLVIIKRERLGISKCILALWVVLARCRGVIHSARIFVSEGWANICTGFRLKRMPSDLHFRKKPSSRIAKYSTPSRPLTNVSRSVNMCE